MGATDRRTTWELSSLADCGSPDRPDFVGWDYHQESALARDDANTQDGSPGAAFLRCVEDAVLELWEDLAEDDRPGPDDVGDLDYNGAVHEIADGAVPVYTHTFWQTFVDLAAYDEDVSDYGETRDVAQAGQIAVYMIGERLAWALLAELAEEWADRDETAA